MRTDKGYKQEYMAEVLQVSQKTYSNNENDKSSISLTALKKIAQEFKVELLELIADEKIIEPNDFLDNSIKQGNMAINLLSAELLQQVKERVEDLKQIIFERDRRIEKLERKAEE